MSNWTREQQERLIAGMMSSGGWFSMHRSLIKELGLEGASVFHYLLNFLQRFKKKNKAEGGWFFCTVDKMESELGLSSKTQRRVLGNLQSGHDPILKSERHGQPPVRYFQINFDRLARVVANWQEDEESTEKNDTGTLRPSQTGTLRPSQTGTLIKKKEDKKSCPKGQDTSTGRERPVCRGKPREGFLANAFHRKAAGKLREILIRNDSDLTSPPNGRHRPVSIDKLAEVICRVCLDRNATEQEIRDVVKWLAVAYKETYTPKMRKATDLYDRWGVYKEAKARWDADHRGESVASDGPSDKMYLLNSVASWLEDTGRRPYHADQATMDEALVAMGRPAGSATPAEMKKFLCND